MSMMPFSRVAASEAERCEAWFGDDIVPAADVVMDRAFSLPVPPETVWPRIEQLGKRRYAPCQRRDRATVRTMSAARQGGSLTPLSGQFGVEWSVVTCHSSPNVPLNEKGGSDRSSAIQCRSAGNTVRFAWR